MYIIMYTSSVLKTQVAVCPVKADTAVKVTGMWGALRAEVTPRCLRIQGGQTPK